MTTPQSLTQQLAEAKAASSKRIPEDARAVMNQATEELQQTKLAEQSLSQGDRLPDVILPNVTGKSIRLYDLWKQGPLVISYEMGCAVAVPCALTRTDAIRRAKKYVDARLRNPSVNMM